MEVWTSNCSILVILSALLACTDRLGPLCPFAARKSLNSKYIIIIIVGRGHDVVCMCAFSGEDWHEFSFWWWSICDAMHERRTES